MNHEQVLERSSQFLDGELPTSEQAEMFRHLSECGDCRTMFERMLRVSRAAQRMLPVSVPPALDQKFAALTPVIGSPRFLERRVSVPAMLLSFIAVMILSVSILVTAADRRSETTAAENPSVQTFPMVIGNSTIR